MVWGGIVFMTGWIMHAISTYNKSYNDRNQAIYISSSVLIYAGPPIYAAAEYNILGRLMVYLPMLAPLHPYRVIYVFIYLGVLVEAFTGSGAPRLVRGLTQRPPDRTDYKVGTILISMSLVLQAAVELAYLGVVGVMYRRASRAGMLTRKVRTLCIMLFGTSTLILSRCFFRALQAFASTSLDSCNSLCRTANDNEWYLYVFEATQMIVYTYWLNFIHPGMLLPRNRMQYLDLDGTTQRIGPGWVDRRPKWETFVDPLDLRGILKGQPSHEKFWLRPEEWPIADHPPSTPVTVVDKSAEKSAA